MDNDIKEILSIGGGCALIGVLSFIGVVWGVVAALKWAFS